MGLQSDKGIFVCEQKLCIPCCPSYFRCSHHMPHPHLHAMPTTAVYVYLHFITFTCLFIHLFINSFTNYFINV